MESSSPPATDKKLPESQFISKLGRHLAHELNNPISAISSAAYLIDDFVATGEEGKVEGVLIQPFVDSIREECMKMKGVIEEFTKFLTTDSVLVIPVALEEFLKARAAENNREGLVVSLKLPEDAGSLQLCADMGQMQYAFSSLANAARVAAATTLDIDLVKTGSIYQFTFRDNRPGQISDEEAEAMLDPTPAKKGRGLGLKLPTVKKIVELHHGSISIEGSDSSGVTVKIELPVDGPNDKNELAQK